MKPILDFAGDNWPALSGILYEVISRIIPTKRNISLIDNAVKLIGFLLKNRRKKDAADVVDFADSTINRVFVERDKHIIPSLVIGMIFLSSLAMAQVQNVTALRLVNVTDSTTVTSNPNTLNPNIATLFMNIQQGKPRIYYGGVGHDLVGSAGGGGNVTGTFATGQLPFATGTHALSSNNTFLWNNTSKTMSMFNSGLTQSLSLTPSSISTTGTPLSINSALNNISLNTTGSGTVALNTATNSITLSQTNNVGGTVSDSWIVDGDAASNPQWTINAVTPNGVIAFQANGTGQSQISVDNDLSINSNGASKSLAVSFNKDISLTATTGDILLDAASNIMLETPDSLYLSSSTNGTSPPETWITLDAGGSADYAVDIVASQNSFANGIRILNDTFSSDINIISSFTNLNLTGAGVNLSSSPTTTLTVGSGIALATDTGITVTAATSVEVDAGSFRLETNDVSVDPGVATLQFVLKNLPTSCSTRPSGTLWNDAGTLKVCP